mgnify:FL=1
MGAESYIYVKCGEKKFTIRTIGNKKYEVGEEVELALNLEKVHLFDKESTLTICN